MRSALAHIICFCLLENCLHIVFFLLSDIQHTGSYSYIHNIITTFWQSRASFISDFVLLWQHNMRPQHCGYGFGWRCCQHDKKPQSDIWITGSADKLSQYLIEDSIVVAWKGSDYDHKLVELAKSMLKFCKVLRLFIYCDTQRADQHAAMLFHWTLGGLLLNFSFEFLDLLKLMFQNMLSIYLEEVSAWILHSNFMKKNIMKKKSSKKNKNRKQTERYIKEKLKKPTKFVFCCWIQ